MARGSKLSVWSVGEESVVWFKAGSGEIAGTPRDAAGPRRAQCRMRKSLGQAEAWVRRVAEPTGRIQCVPTREAGSAAGTEHG